MQAFPPTELKFSKIHLKMCNKSALCSVKLLTFKHLKILQSYILVENLCRRSKKNLCDLTPEAPWDLCFNYNYPKNICSLFDNFRSLQNHYHEHNCRCK